MTAPGPVLVVDDEANIADVVSAGLRLAGFEVLTASGGGEALRLASSRQIGALVLDVMLPDLDGFEVCQQLRARPRWRPWCTGCAASWTAAAIRSCRPGAGWATAF